MVNTGGGTKKLVVEVDIEMLFIAPFPLLLLFIAPLLFVPYTGPPLLPGLLLFIEAGNEAEACKEVGLGGTNRGGGGRLGSEVLRGTWPVPGTGGTCTRGGGVGGGVKRGGGEGK